MNADLTLRFTGRNSALGDSYGLSPADLARLMGEWRDRAVAQNALR